ncbi:serpentine type 7TM GPCR chemoreceptor str domain-containing protein [Ditylenchus destructor]|nr:serpentine type 7TM GPCR chemoreceptor str domain-containing protein [Ditylenchus destructor]
MLELHNIHKVLATFIGVTSLTLNFFLLYLVFKHSTFKEKCYKRILTMTCITDIILTVISFVGEPVLFANNGWTIYVTNGFFAGRSAWFDHLCIALYCSSIHVNIVCVICMFIYRYRVLCRSDNKLFLNGLFAFATIWCGCQIADAVWMYMIEQEERNGLHMREMVLNLLDKFEWQYNRERPPYPSVCFANDTKTLIHHFFYSSSLFGGYVLLIFCEVKIMDYIKISGSVTEKTRRMHAEVNRALIALAITPTLTLMAPVMTLMISLILRLTLGPSIAVISMTMTLITLVNPITSIYFIRPYRRVAARVLCCSRTTQIGSSTLATATATATAGGSSQSHAHSGEPAH